MAIEADELYTSLNKLLDDICKFLSNETNYEKLSPRARKQADELISRSKQKLQEIENITADNDETYGAYVDMERKSDENNENDEDNIYSSVEETTVIPPQPVLKSQLNPYTNLPAKDLSQDIKYGCLSWRCRIILKFEKIRRIYAGVHDNWLLVYSSEKDGKPIQTFDLKFHKAQAVVTSKHSKNPSQDFELVSTAEEKSYYFLALTHKDMLQWVSHINRCHEILNKSNELSTSEESSSETYDIIAELNLPRKEEDNQEDEESIYDDIESYVPEKRDAGGKPPELPARRCIKTNTPLPFPLNENRKNFTESLPKYDPAESRISLESASSFSEDEEDTIYEPFVNTKSCLDKQLFCNKLTHSNYKNGQDIFNKTHKIERTTSISEKPQTPVKPKILTNKPTNIVVFKK